MLHVTIAAVGRLKENFFADAAAEYQKRLGAFCKIDVAEAEEFRLSQNPSPADIRRGLEQEGKSLLSKIPPRAYLIALCIEGKTISSEDLARRLGDLSAATGSAAFAVGGSHGLSPEVKGAADLQLSMSPMTFPHQMARVMLLEQIYRALSINGNRKYHK